MNMTLRLLILLCCLSFSIMASAQASGGQIRRHTQKTKTEVRKLKKPRSNKFSIKNESPATHTVESYEQDLSSYSTSKDCYYQAKKLEREGKCRYAIDLFLKSYWIGESPYSTWALHHIGYIYYYGMNGVKKNYDEAYKNFKKASDNGCLPSMYYLALCYEFGSGVSKDLSKAQYYKEKSGYKNTPNLDF